MGRFHLSVNDKRKRIDAKLIFSFFRKAKIRPKPNEKHIKMKNSYFGARLIAIGMTTANTHVNENRTNKM